MFSLDLHVRRVFSESLFTSSSSHELSEAMLFKRCTLNGFITHGLMRKGAEK